MERAGKEKKERAAKRERGIMWTGKWELKSGLWWGKDTHKTHARSDTVPCLDPRILHRPPRYYTALYTTSH